MMISFLCVFIQGKGCKEGLFNWMLHLPANTTVARKDIRSQNKVRSNAATNFKMFINNASELSCVSSPSSGINFTILPKCMNVTVRIRPPLKMSEGQQQSGLITSRTTSEHWISKCYPLSSQLLECPLIYYEKNCYKIQNETQYLHILKTNYSLALGDYFIDHQERVFLCSKPLDVPVNSPRCNYVVLKMEQFTILSNGSLYVNDTHKLIQTPIYQSINQNSLNICYPLSIEFLTCPESLLYIIPHEHYDVLPGLKIFYRTHNQILDPSQYYELNTLKDIIACVSQDSMETCNLLSNIYVFVDCLSIIFLTFLIIYHLVVLKHSLYKLCLIYHSITMISFYISSGILERIIDSHQHIISCYILFFLKYFAITSTYTWLTMLAFDISYTFSSLLKSYHQSKIVKEKRAFWMYNLFGWGLPFVMCILIAAVEWNTNLQKFLSIYPSVIGSCKCFCWLSNHFALFAIHYGYDTLLSITNIILYIMTVFNIRRKSRECDVMNKRRKQM